MSGVEMNAFPAKTSAMKANSNSLMVDTPDSAKALFWFFIILLILIAIALVIYWIVWSQSPSGKNPEFKRVQARDLDVTRDVEIQGSVNVCDTITTRNLVIPSTLALKPHSTSKPELRLEGKVSSIILENSTSTPINVALPDSSVVEAGYLQLFINVGVATTFTVQPAGSDTLENGTAPLTISARTALFYCLGRTSTSSVANWVQIKLT